MTNKKWYALQCVSNLEKRFRETLSNNLEHNGLSQYIDRIEIPVEQYYVYNKGKKTVREKCLMSGYILILADISNGELLQMIRYTKHFIGFINPTMGGITKKGKPEAMLESDIARFLDLTEENKSPKWKFLESDRVKIIDGAFNTFEADVTSVNNDTKMADVTLKIFGRETHVTLSYDQIEKVSIES